jgi:hypothetical protein
MGRFNDLALGHQPPPALSPELGAGTADIRCVAHKGSWCRQVSQQTTDRCALMATGRAQGKGNGHAIGSAAPMQFVTEKPRALGVAVA